MESCLVHSKAKAALRHFFKYNSFRPGQLAALLPVLHGKDVLVRMATGAGKSLCFYLVPLAASTSAVGVVSSPLNALMDQQVICCSTSVLAVDTCIGHLCTCINVVIHAYIYIGQTTP